MKATLEPDNRAAQRDSSARSDYYLNLASVNHLAEYDLCQTTFWDARQNIQEAK